jgi:hypothetical protein
VDLGLNYSKWDSYETLLKVSGPRMMHKDFCIISDKPVRLLKDGLNRPHCDDGPFCEWADGTKLYAIGGQYVPQYVVERPDLITIEKIQKETNAETRRIMIDRYGTDKYLLETEAQVLDLDERPGNTRCLIQDNTGSKWLVGMDGSTERTYYMPVPEESTTCKEAHQAIACVTDESQIKIEG